MTLQFTEEGHVYHWDGGVVPSATTVLGFVGLGPRGKIPDAVLDAAAERGRTMHDICAAILRGDLDWGLVPEGFELRAESFAERVEEAGLESFAIERPMYDESLGVAGTPDFVGMIYGGSGVVDHKNGARGYVGPQTAFYQKLAVASGFAADRRYVTEWRGDRCRFRRLEDHNDWLDFSAALRLYTRWGPGSGR